MVRFEGVGTGYALTQNVLSLISGEWNSEKEVEEAPCFSWASGVTEFLLDQDFSTYDAQILFKTLLDYLRSKASPNSLKVLPLLIQMLRSGQESNSMHNLSQIIIQTALSKSKSDKLNAISDTLLQLVDLAVEFVQRNESVVVGNAFMGTYSMLADDNDWWHHSKIPHNFPTMDVTVQEKIEALITNKPTIISQLHDIVQFFRSLSTDTPVPSDLVLNLWYKHLSNCYIAESLHPYTNGDFSQTISAPAAERLIVTFDHRCNFDANDVLLLEGAGSLHRIQGDSEIPSTLQINGSYVKISFMSSSPSTKEFWGWACLVHAMGSIYEQRTIEIPTETIENEFSMTDEIYRMSTLDALDRNGPEVTCIVNESGATEALMKSALRSGLMVKSGFIKIPTGYKHIVDIIPPARPVDSKNRLILVIMSIMDEHGDKIGKIVLYPLDDENRFSWTFDGLSGYYALYSIDRNDTVQPVEQSPPAEPPEAKEEEKLPPPVSSPQRETLSSDSLEADEFSGSVGWACPLCTLINDESARTCVACGTVNDINREEDENDEEVSEFGDGAGAVWWCNMCTFLSPLSEPK